MLSKSTSQGLASEEGARWSVLYKLAGASALLMAIFIPIQIIVFVTNPPPATVSGWFTLFQENRLVAMLDMDLLLIVDQVLMAFIFLALYVALERTNPSLMLVVLAFAFLGMGGYFASSTIFNMMALSDLYTAASSETAKTILLAAGQTTLSIWQGTAFDVGYVLEGLALLLAAVVMFKSPLFGRAITYVGIVLGVLSLLPPTAGTIGMIFALGSLVPLEIWDILIARRFFQMAAGESAEPRAARMVAAQP